MRRTYQLCCSANGRKIGKRSVIGGKKKMIAVIDHHIEDRIVIRTAASSGVASRLVQDDIRSAPAKAHRSGEPSKPGADHVDCAWH
jgi:hypothetical protein